MKSTRAIAGMAALLAALAGCGDDDSGLGDQPTQPGAARAPEEHGGPNSESPLENARPSVILAPYAGRWLFDFEKTAAALLASGAPKAEIERMRTMYAQNPKLRKLHGDMVVSGNQAVCSGMPSAQYDFFAMHDHGGKACGKAWHHEDRHDPGDMSKCYARLAIVDNRLELRVRMAEDSPQLDDPELESSPRVDLDSAAHCDADQPARGTWTPWIVYVFTRGQ
jgi:hypothetical protein